MFDYAFVDELQIHGGSNGYGLLPNSGGFGSPVPREDRRDRTQEHGLIDRTKFYAGRVLDLRGIVEGADELETWQRFDVLKGALALGTPHVLRFRRTGFNEDEQVASFIVGSAVDEALQPSGTWLKYGVTVVCQDPRFYSAALKTNSYDPTLVGSGGGITVIGGITFPLAFGNPPIAHVEAVNSGNFPAPPVLTIHGPVVNPVIDNDSTGESISVLYNLGASDVVTIDVDGRVAKLNGAERADLIDAARTTWFKLRKGTNNLRLRGTGMTPDVTQLTAQWRDARI